MSDFLQVASGGTIDLDETCPGCKQPMLYRCKTIPADLPLNMIEAKSKFCNNELCPLWLCEKPIGGTHDAR